MKPVITIVGPTASGKTRFCLGLVDCLPIEVVSVDSRQIYRWMDIGTGKPTSDERKKLTHHLIDIRDPDERYSAYQFGKDCSQIVKEIRARKCIPIICGGTILYIKAILDGLFPEPDITQDIREDIRRRVKEEGPQKMYEKLLEVDSESAQRIHPNDKQRIARALEVYEASGISLTEHWRRGQENKIPIDIYCLLPERELLYKNIGERVKNMFEIGFVKEVENLLGLGFDPYLYSFTSLGYREIAGFIKKNGNIEEIKNDIIKKTKQFATRQITYVKGLEGVQYHRNGDSLKRSIIEKIQKKKNQSR